VLASYVEVKEGTIMVDTQSASKLKIEPGAVYSRQEAAEALGISLSTLKRLIKKGHLQVSKPNGMRRVFITGESIQAMLSDTAVDKGA
jgi:excisionase family DNA binding protein